MDLSKPMDGADSKGRRYAWCGPVCAGLHPEFRHGSEVCLPWELATTEVLATSGAMANVPLVQGASGTTPVPTGSV